MKLILRAPRLGFPWSAPTVPNGIEPLEEEPTTGAHYETSWARKQPARYARFAGWAAIIAVPTMVAGIYGMNFKFMPELELPYAYPVVLFVTFGLSCLLYLLFKRSGWL